MLAIIDGADNHKLLNTEKKEKIRKDINDFADIEMITMSYSDEWIHSRKKRTDTIEQVSIILRCRNQLKVTKNYIHVYMV